MIATGNPDQWDPSYPGRELLVKNITDGQAYVLEEKGKVHRLASDGTVKGAGRACLTYCSRYFCIYCRRRAYVYEDL